MIVMIFDHQFADLEADTEANGQVGHDLNNRIDMCDEVSLENSMLSTSPIFVNLTNPTIASIFPMIITILLVIRVSLVDRSSTILAMVMTAKRALRTRPRSPIRHPPESVPDVECRDGGPPVSCLRPSFVR